MCDTSEYRAKIGAFYIGKNASSIFAPIWLMKRCVAALRGYAFFSAWLRLRTFLFSGGLKMEGVGKFLGSVLFGLNTGMMAWTLFCLIVLVITRKKWKKGEAPKWLFTSFWFFFLVSTIGWFIYGTTF